MNVTITAGPASYTFWNCQKDPTLFPCSFAQERGGCRSQEIFVVQPIRRMYAPQINMSVDTRHWFFLLRDGVAVVYVSSRVGEKKILWIHTPLPSSAGPHNFFFLEQGMHFGALLTPVGQPDIAETIHLSRTCIVVTRLWRPCFARVVVCCCSLFKFFWLLRFAVDLYCSSNNRHEQITICILVSALSKPVELAKHVVGRSWRNDSLDKSTTRRRLW